MLIRFLTRGREQGLNWKTSEGVAVKSVLYNWAGIIAEARLKYEATEPLFIDRPLLLMVHKIKLKEAAK